MNRLSKLSFLASIPLLLCFSTVAWGHHSSSDDCSHYESSDHSKGKYHGKCPINASGYTSTCTTHLEFLIDDNLTTNPVATTLAGFEEFLGFDSKKTEKFWRKGLHYIKCRFGIDATHATFDPILGFTFLTVAEDGSAVQTPEPVASTNVIISPITFTGSGTYRVVESTSPVFDVSPGCKPLVRLVEFTLSFVGEVSLGGTYGAEASETGRSPQIPGDGLAFGRYTIRGADGKEYFFDMRSWIPSHAWPTASNTGYFTERFQINPLDHDKFKPGLGTLTIVSPVNPVITPEGPVYPWYIRNDWWLGPTVVDDFLTDWDGQCPKGNTSKIRSPKRFRHPCPD